MKLRNKKTGEIVEPRKIGFEIYSFNERNYDSLAELNEEWEDYEEPKDIWWLDNEGIVNHASGDVNDSFRKNRKIGNYFLSQEEAEKAAEKLKAITRLNKCGFKFEGYADRDRANGGDIVIYAHIDTPNNNLLEEAQPAMLKDLDLLFGGGE